MSNTNDKCPACNGHKKVPVHQVEDCDRCGATGIYQPPCKKCNGEKFVTVQHGYKATCGSCNGKGFKVELKCRRCKGIGMRLVHRGVECPTCNGLGKLILNPVLQADFSLPVAA